MTGIRRAEIPFAEVEQAVQAHVKADPGGVFRVGPALITLIGGQVGFDQHAARYSWESGRAWDRFAGQIKRALDKLAKEGALRRAGVHDTGPDGRAVFRNEVRWYTPAAWDATAAQAAVQQEAKQAEAARWDAIGDRLHAAGVEFRQYRGGAPEMNLEGWESLLNLAERSEVG